MIKKLGTPNKISEVVKTDKDFEKLKNKVAKDNNLRRCDCGTLLAKFDSGNKIINIQKKKLDFIAEISSGQIKCPNCGSVTNL